MKPAKFLSGSCRPGSCAVAIRENGVAWEFMGNNGFLGHCTGPMGFSGVAEMLQSSDTAAEKHFL
jgi:hypothetical protein